MKQHSEFAIIGGGVLGVSLAYQLSLHGREVLLLEQNEICSGTSSGRGSSTSSRNGNELLESLLDHLLDVLSLEVGKELLNLLVLGFSTDGLKNGLDVLSLLR